MDTRFTVALAALALLVSACGPSAQELANARITNAAADALTQTSAQQNQMLDDLRAERDSIQADAESVREQNAQLVEKMAEQQKAHQATNAQLVAQIAEQQKDLQAHTLRTGELLIEQQQSFWSSLETMLQRQGALEDRVIELTDRQAALLVTLTLALAALSITLGIVAIGALIIMRRSRHSGPVYLPDARGYAILPNGRVEIIDPRPIPRGEMVPWRQP